MDSFYYFERIAGTLILLIVIAVQFHQHRRLLKVEKIIWPLSSKEK